jgi:hypothetical protein
MLEADKDGCFVALKHLHAAYHKKLSADAAEMTFQILRKKQVPLTVLKRAVVLAVESERLLPRVATLLAYCDKARAGMTNRQLPAPEGSPEKDAVEWCRLCDDTGFEPFFCVGREHGMDLDAIGPYYNQRKYEVRECRSAKPHFPHTWVRACECRPTNPVYLKNHPPKAPTFSGTPESGRL